MRYNFVELLSQIFNIFSNFFLCVFCRQFTAYLQKTQWYSSRKLLASRFSILPVRCWCPHACGSY